MAGWPLAGPVVAAAVILESGLNHRRPERFEETRGEAKRDRLAIEIREKALCWSIAEASAEETGPDLTFSQANLRHAAALMG